MRMSASRIRSINRTVQRVGGIICGASDRIVRRPEVKVNGLSPAPMSGVVKVVAVRRPAQV